MAEQTILMTRGVKENPLVNWVHQRIKRNQNVIGICYGATGTGKSLASIRIAEKLDPTFNLDRVVFTVRDLMHVLDSGLKEGNVVIFDEAGTGISARDWYSTQNKLVNYVLQTFRQDNIVLLVTVPNKSFIDSNVRKLFHIEFETKRIDYTRKICYLKVWILRHVQFKDKTETWTLFPKLCYNDGTSLKMRELGLGLPQRVSIREYEHKKKEWRKALHKDIDTFLDSQGDSTIGVSKNITDEDQKVIELKTKHPRLNWHEVAELSGVPYGTVMKIKTYYEGLGYDFPNRKKTVKDLIPTDSEWEKLYERPEQPEL